MKNQLDKQSSLYLKQHQKNPIHWHSWDDGTLNSIKERKRPVFLSIGYSSCHWCHVMARESFENVEVSNFLNENFSSIKIDKEEFPEIDQYYQKAAQAFGMRGGWPLNVFLTPELEVIFIGTYFPTPAKNGAPSFIQVLKDVNFHWESEKEKIKEQNHKLRDHILSFESVDLPEGLDKYPSPEAIFRALEPTADKKDGGYGQTPKFPHFQFFVFALEQIKERTLSQESVNHIMFSIHRFLMGGIVDHLRGGVHRYSVDSKFRVPHFEKMLYDQPGYLLLLNHLVAIAPNGLTLDSIFSTLTYLEKEMLSEEGYFFSNQNAESEEVEGFYFGFTLKEIQTALKEKNIEYEKVKNWFNFSANGDYGQDLNVVSHKVENIQEILKEENWNKIREIKKALYEERAKRIPPSTDNKGIASHNFMLISALLQVANLNPFSQMREKATELLSFSENKIIDLFVDTEKDKIRINHTTTRQETSNYFEDFVFLAEYYYLSYQFRGVQKDKELFKRLIKNIDDLFFDEDSGFSFLSRKDSSLPPSFPVGLQDSSYTSPLSTMFRLWSYSKIMFKDTENEDIDDYIEDIQALSLQSPQHFGEALRTFVYPEEAYHLFKVPLSWTEEEKFQKFRLTTPMRIVYDFHKSDNWQICSKSSCLESGKTLEELIEVLKKDAKKDKGS